jgi:hypothetical protein
VSFVILQDANTLYIALYGAGLSTITLIALIITRYIDHRIRIRVTVGNALTTPDLTKAISIQASNLGTRGTSLGTPYLALPKPGTSLAFMTPYSRNASNPYEISPGKPDLSVLENIAVVADKLKKEGYSGHMPFRAVVPGVGGKEYKSKKMWFDLEGANVLDASLRARLKRNLRKICQ